MRRGFLLAVVNIALVFSIGGKQFLDRSRLPHAWARVSVKSSDQRWSGRYLQLRIEARPEGSFRNGRQPVALSVIQDRLVAKQSAKRTGVWINRQRVNPSSMVVLTEAPRFYIPENIADPTKLSPGEELWVEVIVPNEGLPRPIRLGVTRNGVLSPLEF